MNSDQVVQQKIKSILSFWGRTNVVACYLFLIGVFMLDSPTLGIVTSVVCAAYGIFICVLVINEISVGPDHKYSDTEIVIPGILMGLSTCAVIAGGVLTLILVISSTDSSMYDAVQGMSLSLLIVGSVIQISYLGLLRYNRWLDSLHDA